MYSIMPFQNIAALLTLFLLSQAVQANDLRHSLCTELMKQNTTGRSYEEILVDQVSSQEEAIQVLREYHILGSLEFRQAMVVFMELDSKPWPGLQPGVKLKKKDYLSAYTEKTKELTDKVVQQIDNPSEQKKTVTALLDLLIQRKSVSGMGKEKELVHFTQIVKLSDAIKKSNKNFFDQIILEYARLNIYEELLENGLEKTLQAQQNLYENKVSWIIMPPIILSCIAGEVSLIACNSALGLFGTYIFFPIILASAILPNDEKPKFLYHYFYKKNGFLPQHFAIKEKKKEFSDYLKNSSLNRQDISEIKQVQVNHSVLELSEITQVPLSSLNLTSTYYLGDTEILRLSELANQINSSFAIYESVLKLKKLSVELSMSPSDPFLQKQFTEALNALEEQIDVSKINSLQTKLISELERAKIALNELSDRLYKDRKQTIPTLEDASAEYFDYKITQDLEKIAEFDLKTIASNAEFLRLKEFRNKLRKWIKMTKQASANYQGLAEEAELELDGWL